MTVESMMMERSVTPILISGIGVATDRYSASFLWRIMSTRPVLSRTWPVWRSDVACAIAIGRFADASQPPMAVALEA